MLDVADQMLNVLTIANASWLVGISTHVGGLKPDPAWQAGVKTGRQPVPVTIIA